MTDRARALRTQDWLWGLVVSLAVIAGLCAVAVATGRFGWAFVAFAPFVGGYLIGRWVAAKRAVQVLYGLIALGSIVLGAVTANIAGMICGAVFASIASIPLVAGIYVGSHMMNRTGAGTSIASVALVALLIPLEHHALPRSPIESVSTSTIVPMSAQRTFSRITFYEDTSAEPPRILRIALPRPIRTVGEADSVGDRPRCIYDDGYIVKEITAVERPTQYAFKVIEQVGVESHAVALTTGSFRLDPVDRHRTRVTLTTSYVPKLSARLAWRPFEHAVIRALHRHVLREMMSGPRRGHDA